MPLFCYSNGMTNDTINTRFAGAAQKVSQTGPRFPT